MAQRRTMYRGDRRRKEDQRKAKQEAKRARKAERRESGKGGPEIGEAASLQGSATEFVWFSPSSCIAPRRCCRIIHIIANEGLRLTGRARGQCRSPNNNNNVRRYSGWLRLRRAGGSC